jgi:hypothetical protein
MPKIDESTVPAPKMEESPKAAYASPRIVEFGAATALTRGDGNRASDTGHGMIKEP